MTLYRKLFSLAWLIVQVVCLHLHIDEFYSVSFVPKEIIIAHSLNDLGAVSYNISIKEHFPGKLLMHLYVRRLDDVPGGKNDMTILKLKNLDFCKTLDVLRNVTQDETQHVSEMQTTFLISCPVSPGFYYVRNGYLEENLLLVPLHVGRYFVQFEVIQVYEEVIKLVNWKLKLRKLGSAEKEEDVATSVANTDESEVGKDKVEDSKEKASVPKNDKIEDD